MSTERHFLFLQGMPCDFFQVVGDALELQGHRVSRINLSFYDWLFWHDRRSLSFRGRRKDWPDFFRRFLSEQSVTDLVLLGEQRKYHKEAVALARACGVRVMATDFGYFRPDWITLELNGMGRDSTMPKDATSILALSNGLPEVDFSPQFQDSTWRMSVGELVGSLGDVVFKLMFPHYQRSIERPHPLVYNPAMAWTLLRRKWQARRVGALYKALRSRGRPYFVFPLQLDYDFQIRAYSPYAGMGPAIDEVLESFALNASRDSDLWIKTHPWDPGLIDWKRQVRIASDRLGIAGRVHFLDGGDLDAMMAEALGVVTVNSTSGLKALQLGRPVHALGDAVFDIEGLTHSGSLDSFWCNAVAPDPDLLSAFIRLLVARTQLRGVFFHPTGKRKAVSSFVSRLLMDKF